jgi:multidrug resistance efflux pump
MTVEWLRTRLLPWGMWAVTMATAAWLWRDVRHESAVGFALGVEYKLSPALAARVDAVPVAPGQRVRAGQVVATLDARTIDAELAIVAAERTRLEAELGAIRSETSVRVGESSRELEESVASADLALKSARAERSVRAAEFKALEAQTQRLSELVEQHMADRRELDALRVTHASLQTQLQMADTLVAQLVSQVAGARARRALLPTDATELALGPVHAELAVLAARELLLAAQKDATILRAPADGEVAAVLIHPGEVATVGLPVLTIVGPGPGDEVIVCLSETQAGTVRVGEAAIVTPRGAVGDGLASHVTRVAPQVSELPLRCRRNPQLPEWGREVAVALDTHLPLLPGQAFSVSFLGHPSPHANTDAVPVAPASAPPPAPTPTPQLAAPRPPELPPALAARTRFEPSAIAWLPARDRFVIASDDTGFDKTHEHAPWLFTMDTRGRVDPEPLVVAGVPGFGDLEAVAAGPDGSLFVLASQSRSRKGKRPDSRQLFARVAIDADGARVLASTRLAAQLDAAGARFLATLGLHDTAELDLEGMTTTAAGGLLLGLKQPLDAAGRAPIWHLARPELLLAGDLAAAGLTPWGAVSLTVQADGAPRPAGISDLLELPDGTLVIAGTASGADPTTQDGTIWIIAHGRDGLAAPRVLRSFPGLKPEGVALRPDGAALVVVFDTGAAPGLWMELPWPTP